MQSLKAGLYRDFDDLWAENSTHYQKLFLNFFFYTIIRCNILLLGSWMDDSRMCIVYDVDCFIQLKEWVSMQMFGIPPSIIIGLHINHKCMMMGPRLLARGSPVPRIWQVPLATLLFEQVYRAWAFKFKQPIGTCRVRFLRAGKKQKDLALWIN